MLLLVIDLLFLLPLVVFAKVNSAIFTSVLRFPADFSAIYIYTKSFKMHRGGKSENPQELTQVSDWGEKT